VTAARLSEIEQEQRKSVDASARQVITAPAGGEVIELKYSAPGAVIAPREGDMKLQAGMPAEVYIKGEERTPLQYLVEPVTQVMRHAARER